MKYRKLPVEVNAWPVSQIIRDAREAWFALPEQVVAAHDKRHLRILTTHVVVETLEGSMLGQIEDYLICGIDGGTGTH